MCGEDNEIGLMYLCFGCSRFENKWILLKFINIKLIKIFFI